MAEGEKDPHGKVKGDPGTKFDDGKTPLFRGLLVQFPHACAEVANLSAYGAKKYGWENWQGVPDADERYKEALMRHLASIANNDPWDPDSGFRHIVHVAWNALALIELEMGFDRGE